MSGSPSSVLGFAVIFLIVGALGERELGWFAATIFLVASGALFLYSAITLALFLARRRRLRASLAAEPVPEAVAQL
jgi:hypothetical protein